MAVATPLSYVIVVERLRGEKVRTPPPHPQVLALPYLRLVLCERRATGATVQFGVADLVVHGPRVVDSTHGTSILVHCGVSGSRATSALTGGLRNGPAGGLFFFVFNPLTKAGDYKTPASVSLFIEAGKSNCIHSPQINHDHLLDAVATLTSINPK